MIETIQQAESAIAEICEWIKRQPTHYNPYIDGPCYEDIVVDAVFSWCARLSESSGVIFKVDDE